MSTFALTLKYIESLKSVNSINCADILDKLVCLLLAIKINEDANKNTIKKLFENLIKRYSKIEIVKKEVEICKKLDYKLHYDYIEIKDYLDKATYLHYSY